MFGFVKNQKHHLSFSIKKQRQMLLNFNRIFRLHLKLKNSPTSSKRNKHCQTLSKFKKIIKARQQTQNNVILYQI